MLLPSALPCDAAQTTYYKSIRPRLLSYRPYATSQPKPQTALQSTCQALQTLLDGSPVQPATTTANAIYHPNSRDRFSTSRAPLQARRHNTSLSNTRVAKPSPLKASALPACGSITPGGKRWRMKYQTPSQRRYQVQEQAQQTNENRSPDTDMLMTLEEEDNIDTMAFTPLVTPPQEPSTPYHRPQLPILPLSMPLGLSSDDFVALSPPLTPPCPSAAQFPSLDLDCSTESKIRWSPSDDSALVHLVLEKMKLSTRQWNDCARTLGRDRNSVGARWKVLVHEGEVGLRRGRRTL